jgi:predicted kinase
LEEPSRKPCLLLVGGLPGSGKSTLARVLAEQAHFEVIRSDVVRKELVTAADSLEASPQFGTGIYSPAWNERTYRECHQRAERLLFEGRRVIVDASFCKERYRRWFLDLSDWWRIPCRFLLCHANETIIRERLAGRQNDASDATWAIYQQAAERWEEPSEKIRSILWDVNTERESEDIVSKVLDRLSAIQLFS